MMDLVQCIFLRMTKRITRSKLNKILKFIKSNSNFILNSYATVRKEPPRPVRRKRSTKSLGDRQFATLPLLPKRSDHDVRPPRPPRNYSTINTATPSKPPRRKSAGSLVEISK